MMNEQLERTLEEAYELIEANRIDEAKNLLEPLLELYPNEIDLWWVYAHAVDKPKDAERVLEHIVKIDPNYANAGALLEEVRATEPSAASPTVKSVIKPLKPKTVTSPESAPVVANESSDFDDTDFDDDEDLEDETAESGQTNWIWITLAASLFAVISMVAIYFGVQQNTNNPTPAASNTELTSVAQSLGGATEETTPESTETEVSLGVPPTETEAPTETATDIPTETPIPATNTPTPRPTNTPQPTETATPESQVDYAQLFADFELNGTDPIAQSTALGETLLIEVCVQDQPRETVLSEAMNVFTGADVGNDDIDAVGVRLFDCEQERLIRAIAVSLEDIASYNDGTLTDSDFQLRWRVVG